MKVLLVNGSPHKEGCTYTALAEVAGALEKDGIGTEIVWLGQTPTIGCMGCGACGKLGKCVHDDIVNVLGSPVHYAAASGQITCVLDRLFYSASGALRYKPAAAVVSARRGGTTAALEQLNKYFTINQMPLVSSRYWPMVHGNTPDQVRQDEEGLAIMRQLGHNMAWIIKCIAAGRDAGVDIPAQEPPVRTNFIR